MALAETASLWGDPLTLNQLTCSTDLTPKGGNNGLFPLRGRFHIYDLKDLFLPL